MTTTTIRTTANDDEVDHFVVVVLGDLGRSPRMQYHTLSLLKAGHYVSFVGYEGTDLVPDLCDDKSQVVADRLHVIRFTSPTPPAILRRRRVLLPLYLLWRVLSLVLCLMYALFVSVPARQRQSKNFIQRHVDCVLVQNPPAIPLLAIAYLYCRFVGARFIIDWHNLGFSMLSNPFFASLTKHYEKFLAPFADGHLCVTNAMKSYLEQQFRIRNNNIRVLYDCPPSMFRPLPLEEQHQLLTRLHSKLCENCPKRWYQNLTLPDQTLLTEALNGPPKNIARSRPGRPALVTSSTSWTEDEDFGQLLDALVLLDDTIRENQEALNVLVVVTGKGPQKAMYEERISRLHMERVAVQTIWLEPADYPRLLACADVGVSLHTSTSGLDLPMKVLDLFGCQVPVIARNFHCLHELVQNNENGTTFESSVELAHHLHTLLQPLGKANAGAGGGNETSIEPHSYGQLATFSKALQGRKRWDENWNQHALQVLTKNKTNSASLTTDEPTQQKGARVIRRSLFSNKAVQNPR